MSQAPDAFTPRERARIEATALEIGRFIFQRCRSDRRKIFDRRWWDDQMMAWAMGDEALKVQMFRFVDVLPMLHTNASVTQHLQEYFRDVRGPLPGAVRLGLAVASPRSLVGRAVAAAAQRTCRAMPAASWPEATRRKFWLPPCASGSCAVRSRSTFWAKRSPANSEADRYQQLYIDLIRNIASTVNAWPEVPQADRGSFTALPRVNVSVKLSALDSQFDAIDPQGTTERVAARLRPLLRVARAERVFVHVDMESYAAKDLTLSIFQQVLAEPEFRDWPNVGIVIQAYLRDAAADLTALRDWARRRGTPVWVRLVKGAYWDYETIHAQALDWPIPVFQQKWESDANFERLTEFLLRNYDCLRPALGSHNIRSLAYGIAVAPPSGHSLQRAGIANALWHGRSGKAGAGRHGLPVAGLHALWPTLAGHVVPRASLVGKYLERVVPEGELQRPCFAGEVAHESARTRRGSRSRVGPAEGRTSGGRLVASQISQRAVGRFRRAGQSPGHAEALRQIGGQLGRHYPLWIDGQAVDTPSRITSSNPSHRHQVVGTVAAGRVADVAAAVAAAKAALPAWNALGVDARATFLEAPPMPCVRRRFELAAWQVYECGKGWREADADVTEAIDFCRYYALEARKLHGDVQDVPGEENQMIYMPRGVVG